MNIDRRRGDRNPVDPDEPDAPRFEPSTVDEEAREAEVTRLVDALTPDAIDEATGHVLDNLINHWASKWIADVTAEYAQYRGRVGYAVDRAFKLVDKLRVLRRRDDRGLQEAELARDAAIARLATEAHPGDRAATRPADQSAAAVSHFGHPGYSDPSLAAGRPWQVWLHVVALLAAVGADIGAFYQVVQLIMPLQAGWVAFMVVVGFAAVALYLAHSTGVQLRERRAGVSWVRWVGATLCLTIWLCLGLLAFWIRLVGNSTISQTPSFTLNPTTPSTAPDHTLTLAAAAIFLALYVGSGLAAMVGAYLSHNRLRDSYAKAARHHARAEKRVSKRIDEQGSAYSHWHAQVNARAAAETVYQQAVQHRLALAEQLKQHTRVLIAARIGDPPLTDALLKEDGRVYNFPPQPGLAGNG